MATTNIKTFNESLNNALTDSQYENSQDRINGVLGQIAKSNVHNKLFAQLSSVAYAVAKFIQEGNYDAIDADPNGMKDHLRQVILDMINQSISDRIPSTRASSTNYKRGDVVESPYIPKWGELECIQAGKSATTDVLIGINIKSIGQQINDGNCVWAIRPKRFKSLKNVPVPFRGSWTTPTLVSEPSYPIHSEIGLPMVDYRLCDGSNGTFDMRDRFIMGTDKEHANQRGGSDTFSIQQNNLPTGKFSISASTKEFNGTVKKEFTTGGQSKNHTHGYSLGMLIPQQTKYSSTELPNVNSLSTAQTGGASNDHTHKVTVDLSAQVKHSHAITGDVTLNSGSQKTISKVSQHYKMTYIQRIY